MPRYVAIARPRGWDDTDHEGVAAQDYMRNSTVWEAERKPEPTGLLDASGTPLYRMPDAKRIGFIRD